MASNEAIENASPLHDLTGFQRDALAVISLLDEPKGLRIKDELDRAYGADINHGRLYPNLDSLVEKGLVEKGRYDDRTNKYTLTRRGRRELESHFAWLAGAVDR